MPFTAEVQLRLLYIAREGKANDKLQAGSSIKDGKMIPINLSENVESVWPFLTNCCYNTIADD